MTTSAIEGPWYRALSRSQWNALIASNLGWLFDGFETYALILTAGVALRQLLDPSQYGQIPSYIGTVIAITLLGWGIGGMLGGILADYIGRKRTMVIAIIAYSIATGLSAFAFDWISFVALRFLVGIAIGSEWATGSSMLAELWPDRARGKGAGIMQCGLGLGFFLASFTWLFLSQAGPGCLALHVRAWRASCAADAVDQARHSGIENLGGNQPEAARWRSTKKSRVSRSAKGTKS